MSDPMMQSFANRVAVLLGSDAPWWWLSFADGSRPEGSQFLGVTIVQGLDVGSASMAAHGLGINPGGGVMGGSIPEHLAVPERFRNRLLTREECDEIDALWGGNGTTQEEGPG